MKFAGIYVKTKLVNKIQKLSKQLKEAMSELPIPSEPLIFTIESGNRLCLCNKFPGGVMIFGINDDEFGEILDKPSLVLRKEIKLNVRQK